MLGSLAIPGTYPSSFYSKGPITGSSSVFLLNGEFFGDIAAVRIYPGSFIRPLAGSSLFSSFWKGSLAL
jgi:hypothetical protein